MLHIIGCGGHARSVADVFLQANCDEKIVFYDNNARAEEKILGFPVKLMPELDFFVGKKIHVAIGDNDKRRNMCNMFQNVSQVSFPNIISKYAAVSSFARLGKGIFVGDFCHIGPEALIGDFSILNNSAVIEHEVMIGAYTHVAPRVVISGRSQIGDDVFLGVGSVVKDNINIENDFIVGAGGIVVKKLCKRGIYIGCPARIRERLNEQ